MGGTDAAADTKRANGHVHANGDTNGYHQNGLANGHAAGEDADDKDSHCSEKPAARTWAPVAGAWQAVRQQLLCSRTPPAVPEIYRQVLAHLNDGVAPRRALCCSALRLTHSVCAYIRERQ